MDRGDLEELAVRMYRVHGLDPERATSTATVAMRVLNDREAITRAPLSISGVASRYTLDGRERIGVKRGLPKAYQLFYIGHELSHILLDREGYRGHDIEAACDYLGAALGAPRPAVRRMYKFLGLDLEALAKGMRTTQTGAGLRVGEAVELPVATLSPVVVRARGPEEWAWPDAPTIRRWARGVERPGLKKVPITDGRGRLALVGGED